MRNTILTVVMIGALAAILLLFLETPATPRGRATSGQGQRQDPVPANAPEGDAIRAERLYFRGEYEEAAAAYRLRVQDRPEDGQGWARLAFATHEMGDFEAAIGYHKKAATFDENRITSPFKLACALARLGRVDEAIAALSGAIDAGYRDRLRAELEADLDALRGDERFARLLDRMAPPLSGLTPLDFSAGRWIIRDPVSGQMRGNYHVNRNGTSPLFTEDWVEFSGRLVRGMSYLDPAEGAWKMIRVDEEGVVDQLEADARDGALHLSGERRQFGSRVLPLRGVIEPSGRDRIHVLLESSEDGGSSWSVRSEWLLSRDDASWSGRGGRR